MDMSIINELREMIPVREPTRWERFVFLLTRCWPESYVAARLANIAENEARAEAVFARWQHEQEA